MSLTNLAKAVVEKLNGQAQRGLKAAKMYAELGRMDVSADWADGSDSLSAKSARIKAWLAGRRTQRAVVYHF